MAGATNADEGKKGVEEDLGGLKGVVDVRRSGSGGEEQESGQGRRYEGRMARVNRFRGQSRCSRR